MWGLILSTVDINRSPLERVVTAMTKHGVDFQYRALWKSVKERAPTVVMSKQPTDNVFAQPTKKLFRLWLLIANTDPRVRVWLLRPLLLPLHR